MVDALVLGTSSEMNEGSKSLDLQMNISWTRFIYYVKVNSTWKRHSTTKSFKNKKQEKKTFGEI